MKKKHILAIGVPCYLRLKNNCLDVIGKDNNILEHIVLEEIEAIILDEYSLTLSLGLLRGLLEQNVLVVLCGKNHIPSAVLLPLDYHFGQTKVIQQQIGISEPLKKRIWQRIVQKKIENQALVLKKVGKESIALKLLGFAQKVKSGDSSNIEAQAARFYFLSLFGNDFRRDRKLGSGPNLLLNFGYTLLRTLTLKALIGTGLNPSLGVFHKGEVNPFGLADDFIEIIRPLCDLYVFDYIKDHPEEIIDLGKQERQYLIKMLGHKMQLKESETTLMMSMVRFSESYKKSLEEKKANLIFGDFLF